MDYQLLSAICEMETRYVSDMEHIYSVEEDDIILDREAPEKDPLERKVEELDAKLAEVSPEMARALCAVAQGHADVYDYYEYKATPEELREYLAIKPLAQEVYLLEYAYDIAQEYDYLPFDLVEDTNEYNYLYFNCVECSCGYVLAVLEERHAMNRERHLRYMEAYLKEIAKSRTAKFK